ncbi:importin-4-like isoform X2 [Mytilus galloprovincialis]|uniref:importin-4-like isoform X2 n=1 Tax=Mytilus galloprovincialis TaxID=29158 RepID=UPI003F7C77B9
MSQELEDTLAKLLVPDNNTIQQATQQLKELFKDPDIIPGLCKVLGLSQVPQVRQYAAVLIRRKIQKSRHWHAQSVEIQQNIRENILQILLQESEKNVRNAIAQVVATVAKHDLPKNQWPQLFQFLTAYTKSQNPGDRETGMYLLYTVSSSAAEQLKPHLVSLLQLLSEVISDNENQFVPYYVVRTLTELIFFVGDDEVKYVQEMLPRIIDVAKVLIPIDEDQACEVLEVFDEMLECEVAMLVPHMKTVVDFCIETAANDILEDKVRVKGMSFIATLIKLKKKTFLKMKLVDPVLNVLFALMCGSGEEDNSEEEEEDLDSYKPAQYAPQVIDTMALHLPPEKLIPNLMQLVEPLISSENPLVRRACFLSVAVVAEGCADYIIKKHLQPLLHCVVSGLNDPDQGVRNGALFAMGQFSEHLQPDISKYASEILPLVFQYLGRATNEIDKNPKGLVKSYYALEMFCENLGNGIEPYLQPLMEHLLEVLKIPTTSVKQKQLAISAIGATANAAKTLLKPYFHEIIELFKVYLTAGDEESVRKLQIQVLDTLAVIARSIGNETFMPLAQDSAVLGISLLETVDDPDLRRCVYSLFAALSSLLQQDMIPYMEKLVMFMINSIKSTEGVKTHYKDEEEQVIMFNEEDFCDEEDLTAGDSDQEEDSKIHGISVENAYLDEKEDACCALGELAGNAGSIFFPYLEQSFGVVLEMANYPTPGVKKAALVAVGNMCICVHKANLQNASEEINTVLTNMLQSVVKRILEIVQEDTDRTVVMTAIDTLYEMLEKIGRPVLDVQGATGAILARMKEAFTNKLSCQDEDTLEDDDQQAEFDGMLIESAGDVLPVMAKLLGGDIFLPFFRSFLVDLLKRLKETSSVSEKSFAVGTLAETLLACGQVSVNFVDPLYPLFMKMIRDEDEEVRSNSIFALGVLMANSGDKLFSHYTQVLKTLFAILNKEGNPRVIDNVCAATCRMISTHKSALPLEQVIPVIVQCLPLKEDFEENETVYNCLLQLYSDDIEIIKAYIPKILESISCVVGTEKVKQDVQSTLVHFVKDVSVKYPGDYQAVRNVLPAEKISKLDACLQMSF